MPYLPFLQDNLSCCGYCQYACHAGCSPRYCPRCGYPNWGLMGGERPVQRAERLLPQYLNLSLVSVGADPTARTKRTL